MPDYYPVDDIENTSFGYAWRTGGGSTINLHLEVDETGANDGDASVIKHYAVLGGNGLPYAGRLTFLMDLAPLPITDATDLAGGVLSIWMKKGTTGTPPEDYKVMVEIGLGDPLDNRIIGRRTIVLEELTTSYVEYTVNVEDSWLPELIPPEYFYLYVRLTASHN